MVSSMSVGRLIPFARWAGVAVAALLVVLAASARAEAHSRFRVTSVKPNPVHAGQSVTLGMEGLGKHRPIVLLNGYPMRVQAWSSTSITFVVPENTRAGKKVVLVWAPILKLAWTNLTVEKPLPPFDGVVAPQLNTAAATSQRVGPEGGSISAAGATLTVPPGALLDEVEITMTPVDGIDSLPVAALFDAMHFEPSGLRFLTPATLSLPRPSGLDEGDLAVFLYEGVGDDAHLIPYALTENTIELKLAHFTGAGSGAGGGGFSSYSPNGTQAQAEQQIALAQQQYANGQITDAQRDAAYDAALTLWYQSVHAAMLAADPASGAPLEYLEFAIQDWNVWFGQVADLDREAAHTAEILQARVTARLLTRGHALSLLDQCTGAGADPFVPVPALNRLGQMLSTDPVTFNPAVIDPSISTANDIVGLCVRIEIDPLEAPAAFARFSDHNTIEFDARVAFYNGPSRSDIPLVAELDEVSQNGTITRAIVNTNTGNVSTPVRIEEPGGSSRIVATVHLGASATRPELAYFTTSNSVTRPTRLRTELEYSFSGGGAFASDLLSINEGQTATFQVLLAGDGMDSQTVQFARSQGDGTVQPPSGTTSSSGLTAFNYQASATAGARSCVSATWSFAGAQEGATDCFDVVGATPTPTSTPLSLPTPTPTPQTEIGSWAYDATSVNYCAFRLDEPPLCSLLDPAQTSVFISGDGSGLATLFVGQQQILLGGNCGVQQFDVVVGVGGSFTGGPRFFSQCPQPQNTDYLVTGTATDAAVQLRIEFYRSDTAVPLVATLEITGVISPD